MNTVVEPTIFFKPSQRGLEKFLGRLEAAIMEIMWASGPMTVKRARYLLGEEHPYAYTTVMTVMNRLVEKRLLTREKKGHSFLYTPAISKKEFLYYAIEKIMSGLQNDFAGETGEVFARRFKKAGRKI
ncbi:MAG: BlaI/MecI/CopY family transcriptional regulator [Candidatus Zixiibacteriota bacterium]|nr:MAG: BlaI/MecI/CopY family transcriptional regulator [candidate division Zixibacteria bacterium]